MDAEQFRKASTVAQATVALFNDKMKVDGKWGRFSAAAYLDLTSSQQQTIDLAVGGLGIRVSELLEYRNAARALEVKVSGAMSVEVRNAISSAALESGVSEKVLQSFAKIESGFNPKASNGSSRGLLQMQPAAWATARGVNPSLAGYDKVFDALENARAGAALVKSNISSLKRYGISDPTPAQLYLAHQQGAAGFNELYRTLNGLPVTTNFVREIQMKGNPPHDGKGVTLDRAEFARRWLAVADRLMA